jgi:hypothetical protein
MKAILLSLGLLVIPITWALKQFDLIGSPSFGVSLVLVLITVFSWINGIMPYVFGSHEEEEFHLLGQTVFWLFTLSIAGYIAILILNEILRWIYEVLKAIYE